MKKWLQKGPIAKVHTRGVLLRGVEGWWWW
jgi:hypothetical protein